jgi:hypothetical protein
MAGLLEGFANYLSLHRLSLFNPAADFTILFSPAQPESEMGGPGNGMLFDMANGKGLKFGACYSGQEWRKSNLRADRDRG